MAAECQCSHPGIAEQVQGCGVGAAIKLGAHPLPHGCHVGEKTEVPEGCGLHVESEIIPAEWPATLRQVASQIPAPAAVLVRSGDEVPRGIPIDRKSGVKGKSVSVRVDLGGRGILKKKTRRTMIE